MSKAQLIGGIIGIALAVLLYAIIGAVSMATTALIIAGGLYLLGFVGMGLAQAIAIWLVAIGAVLGIITGILQILVLAGSR